VLDPATGELLDEPLVLRFDSPRSSTGEDMVELHCHGGRAVVDAVIRAICALPGVRAAEPGEFTRRAFANGRIDLTQAEGLADLLEAETETQRKAALMLADGALRAQVEQWRQDILALSAQAELAIDYVGEDEESVADLGPAFEALVVELRSWLERPRAEPLKDGIRVVLAGPPNSGKSSLLNALVGYERAIVAEQAGTTRDHIEVALAVEGIPLLLTDTAGLREAEDSIEASGIERAGRLVELADVLLWLGDPDKAPRHQRLIRVHSKADLPEREIGPRESVVVSAVTGSGIAELMAAVTSQALSFVPAEDAVTLNRRQARQIEIAADALESANLSDPVLAAESLRAARDAFDRISGRAGIEDFLDTLFGRFCLGK